jgi:hypothetical protein
MECGAVGRQFFAKKMWAPNAAATFIAEHLKSLMEYPPRRTAHTLSLKKMLKGLARKMVKPRRGNQ